MSGPGLHFILKPHLSALGTKCAHDKSWKFINLIIILVLHFRFLVFF